MKTLIIKGSKEDSDKILTRLAEENKGKTLKQFLDEQSRKFGTDKIILC